jgi:hypothetical protein
VIGVIRSVHVVGSGALGHGAGFTGLGSGAGSVTPVVSQCGNGSSFNLLTLLALAFLHTVLGAGGSFGGGPVAPFMRAGGAHITGRQADDAQSHRKQKQNACKRSGFGFHVVPPLSYFFVFGYGAMRRRAQNGCKYPRFFAV